MPYAQEKLTLLPFPQLWKNGTLSLRAVVLFRGSPMDPLITGVPGVADGPAFADADIRIEARMIPSLVGLPDPADPSAKIVDLGVVSPPSRRALFDRVAAEFIIDPAIEAATQNPRRGGRQIKKLLTASYTNAFAFGGPRTPFAVLGDEYACAMRRGCNLAQPPGPSPSPKSSWGRVISQCLRQSLLAEKLGLLFTDLDLPLADFYADGGWLFLALTSASAYFDHVAADPTLLLTYAARIPSLAAAAERPLFAPVLYPVTSPIPALDYDEIYGETAQYDDGFAKIVHCAQQTTALPIGLESEVVGRQGPPPAPVRDSGIQLGWDDEQLVLWMNRQIADPAVEKRQSPMVVRGFRVDVRETGDVDWHSLMQVEADLTVGAHSIGHFAGELAVEIAPIQLENRSDGDYWMPAYFTQWQDRSLVTVDKVGLRLSGQASPSGRYTPVDDHAVELRYGREYEFRVRLSDLSNGGPEVDRDAINPSPAPVGSSSFRRFVPPGLPRIEGAEDLDPLDPPILLSVTRPRLGYPAAVFTGAPNATDRLLDEVDRIKAEHADDVPTIPDPDVATAEITVYVQGLRFDSANDRGGTAPLRALYTTSRPFPADSDQPLQIGLDWIDAKDATTITAPAAGALPVPRARDLVVEVRAVGKQDDALGYFGSEAARFGDSTSVRLRAAGADERDLFTPDTPGNRFRCVLLRPQEKATKSLLARLQASGRRDEADNDPLHLLAAELELKAAGRALWAEPGRRVIFGCSKAIPHVLSPDGSAITFSSQADLTDRWIAAITVSIQRDWTWRGDGTTAVEVRRNGKALGGIALPSGVNPEVFQGPEAAGAPVDRSATHLVFFDAVDPKPTPPNHPAEMTLSYELTPGFREAPQQKDSPLKLEADLPIAAPPTQTPKLASAGVALSTYERATDYSATQVRRRMLWLEFEEPPANPADAYFARVLSYAPDPMLTREREIGSPPEPPLAIDPEYIRVIRPDQSDDRAGLAAMQRLIPTKSPRHFLVPLPPGLQSESRELLGFFVYELRLGHALGWSTARARFGPPLRVTGVQHPAPLLSCQAFRTPSGLTASAAFAAPVYEERSLLPSAPATAMWIVLYAQVTQVDGADRRNILLSRRQADWSREMHGGRRAAEASGDTRWSQAEIEASLAALGLPKDSSLSVLAIELLPEAKRYSDPVGSDLGSTRILRASPLVPVPPICVQPPCP